MSKGGALRPFEYEFLLFDPSVCPSTRLKAGITNPDHPRWHSLRIINVRGDFGARGVLDDYESGNEGDGEETADEHR